MSHYNYWSNKSICGWFFFCLESSKESVCVFSTDLWQDKFKNCRMENTTFLHPKKGCHLNFQEENDIVIYLVSFLGSLAVLPGNIISALFMDKIGRIRIIGDVFRNSQSELFGADDRKLVKQYFLKRSNLARITSLTICLSFCSRRFYACFVGLYVPYTFKLQSRSRDLLAVSFLRCQCGSLEWAGSHFCGALPFLKKVHFNL